jgi:predicted transcriptional regulator
MNLNEKQMYRIVKCLSNNDQRKIIKSLKDNNAYAYSELKKILGYYPDVSGKFAYNIRTLSNTGIIKKEMKGYFLTRIGVQLAHLLDDFEKVCMSYDISDLDADGKIEMTVRGRKI